MNDKEFTYRVYPDANDKSVYFDIIHTPPPTRNRPNSLQSLANRPRHLLVPRTMWEEVVGALLHWDCRADSPWCSELGSHRF
ncbi:DUF4822 domain-containing protein [Nocardia tengchongensis]|uniref:DUF4822 domain-containing protein n=1 Tax=Nocardia tengchongensis TaxID=2055889 RepID=UPI0036AB3301